MNFNKRQRTNLLMLLPLLLLLLACQPYLGGDDEDSSTTEPPIQIGLVSWQCPTPSPIPTVTIDRGYWPTPEPPTVEAGTPTVEWNPTAEPRIEFSTPEPTATPYIRSGGDYFLTQRVQVGPVIISATSYQVRALSDGEALHIIGVQVENPGDTVEIHFELLSVLRSIKRPDGRQQEGSWYPEQEAYEAAGLAYDEDSMGYFGSGTTTVQVAIKAPAGEAIAWGMPFENTDESRNGGTGGGYVWWTLRQDPNCTRGPGDPAGENDRPVGTPSTGSGSWPVPSGTLISRGYGCHSFYTGVRGPGCPADAPWWHDGIDFAAPRGTPLYATQDMTILYAGPDSPTSFDCRSFSGNDDPQFGFGNYIKTQDGAGYTYWYGHVASWRVSSGQVVRGRELGAMGSTGCSTGPHLHFRVRLNGVDRNPLDVIAEH